MKKTFLSFFIFAALSTSTCFALAAWQDMTRNLSGEAFYSIAESPAEGGVIYVGTSNGLYRAPRKNGQWDQIFMCRGEQRGVSDIQIDGEGALYIATKNGLYKSRDSGKNWARLFRGLGRENYCTRVLCDGEKIYLGTLKGLFRTKDGGKTWQKAGGILGDSAITAVIMPRAPAGGERLFIIGGNEVYKARTDLKSYEKVFGSDFFEAAGEFEADSESAEENDAFFLLNDLTSENGMLYLSTNRGLFTSGPDGASWSIFNGAGLSDRRINSVLADGGTSRIFATTRGGVFEYTEKERLWRALYSGITETDARKIILAQDGNPWVLCERRVYRAVTGYPCASGEDSAYEREILSAFNGEPTVNETMNMAICYAEVYPEKIEKWRRGAKFKALLPRVNLGIDQGFSDTYEIYTSSSKQYWVTGPRDWSTGWDLNLSWDLSDLVWNPSQTTIDIRSKLMVQLRDDIVDEVTRTYFERRRLQIEILTEPPESAHLTLKKRLRIQELTASLDGLTGGRFSESIGRRG